MSNTSNEFTELLYENANILLEMQDYIDNKGVSKEYIEARIRYSAQKTKALMEKYGVEYLHTESLRKLSISE